MSSELDYKKIVLDGDDFLSDGGLKERAERISAALYNKGLKLAQMSAVTGAIDALERSLEFNKKSIFARNLLGLCYYAVGRLGDALCHWIISQAYQEDDNPADAYINEIRVNQRFTDKINHSITLYNSALDFFKSGNGDMSIIRLKKCVELNPSFVDGLNLLSLGYMTVNKPQNAEPYIKKALQIDPFNQIALSYYAEVTGANQQAGRLRGTGKPQLMDVRGYSKPSNARNIVNDLHLSEVICFLIGCAIVVAVFFFLVLPDRDQKLIAENSRLKEDIVTTQEASRLALEEKDNQYKDHDATVAGLQNQIAELSAQISLRGKIDAIAIGWDYYNAGDYMNAFSQAFDNPPDDGFTPEQIADHAKLLHDSSAQIEAGYYSIAKGSFDKGLYDEANWNFTLAMRFMQGDSPNAHLIYYYMGRIAEQAGKTESAINYYNTVVTVYPDSSQFRDANTRLGRLRG
ncbi:MAG: tetratricopeptide repeat protein [Clostridiales bacterium]|nr:tetratricopeptide repeat protein [Clostridiales bacterium]